MGAGAKRKGGQDGRGAKGDIKDLGMKEKMCHFLLLRDDGCSEGFNVVSRPKHSQEGIYAKQLVAKMAF